MLLRELFKGPDADAAFCFGRFNPAHQGHIEVWKAVQSAGHKWFVGTNPSTQGPNDPLRFEEKSEWMMAIYPPIKGHIMPEQSVVTLASRLYRMLGDGKSIAYVTDSKDWAWAGKVLNDYNGKEGPHGYYKFSKIMHVESPRVSSATALRAAARAGDEEAFYAASGTDPELRVGGKTYYEVVQQAVYANPEKIKKAKAKKDQPEKVAETKRMSAAVKLQRALDRERARSDASRRRGEEVMAQAKKDAEKDRKQDVAEGFTDTIKKKAKQFGRYMTEPQSPHNELVRNRAKNIANIRKKEDQKSVFEKDPEAMREYKRSAEHIPGLDIMGWQLGWAAAKNARGQSMKDAFQQLYYGGGSPFPFDIGAFRLAWVAYNKHYGPQADFEEGVAEGAAKYKVKVVGKDKKGDYYVSPNSGKKVYKPAKVGDHETPSGEVKPKVGEDGSKAMAQTAKRLTNPDDGKVAKLRAAGDKRREDQLKYRDIAKRN